MAANTIAVPIITEVIAWDVRTARGGNIVQATRELILGLEGQATCKSPLESQLQLTKVFHPQAQVRGNRRPRLIRPLRLRCHIRLLRYGGVNVYCVVGKVRGVVPDVRGPSDRVRPELMLHSQVPLL